MWEIVVPKEKMGGQFALCGKDESCNSCRPVTEFSHYNGPEIYLPIAFQYPHLRSGGNTNLPSAFQVFCENQ